MPSTASYHPDDGALLDDALRRFARLLYRNFIYLSE